MGEGKKQTEIGREKRLKHNTTLHHIFPRATLAYILRTWSRQTDRWSGEKVGLGAKNLRGGLF